MGVAQTEIPIHYKGYINASQHTRPPSVHCGVSQITHPAHYTRRPQTSQSTMEVSQITHPVLYIGHRNTITNFHHAWSTVEAFQITHPVVPQVHRGRVSNRFHRVHFMGHATFQRLQIPERNSCVNPIAVLLWDFMSPLRNSEIAAFPKYECGLGRGLGKIIAYVSHSVSVSTSVCRAAGAKKTRKANE